jgi:hypothetical protein
MLKYTRKQTAHSIVVKRYCFLKGGRSAYYSAAALNKNVVFFNTFEKYLLTHTLEGASCP